MTLYFHDSHNVETGVIHQPAKIKDIKVFLCDMDATFVTGETLDDLACAFGLGEQVAEITARAMNGEMDFHTALEARVGLLKGQPVDALGEVREHLQCQPGALSFLQRLRERGIYTVLISGGFTFFTAHIAELAGFDRHIGNMLEQKDGQLTGRVIPPVIDKDAKRKAVVDISAELGYGPENVMALGDGANDILMLQEAGLGIGFQPKPAVRQATPSFVSHFDQLGCLLDQL